MKRFYLSFVGLGTVLAFLLGMLFPSTYMPATYAVAQQPVNSLSQQHFSSGEFDSIILDFLETPDVLSNLSSSLTSLSQQFNLKPALNLVLT